MWVVANGRRVGAVHRLQHIRSTSDLVDRFGRVRVLKRADVDFPVRVLLGTANLEKNGERVHYTL